MPGRVFLTSPISDVATALATDPAPVADERPRRNIGPGADVVALTSVGLRRMRWGIVPVGRVNARGRPVMETIVNARSETVFAKTAYLGVGRAVLPVNGWYEWTGQSRRKTAWEITPADGGFLWFAAITDLWTAPGGQEVAQLATVTCDPNEDISPIHHRMAVILETADIPLWLAGSVHDVTPLMRPWPPGRLQVREADPVWFR